MGSLAGLLKAKGFDVSGSDDNVYPPMSDQLAALGISVKAGFQKENIGNPDFVIVGNACSKNHVEVLEAQARNLPLLSMPEAIERFLIQERFPIVVAGTHGKTTTAALASWILERTGQAPGFLVGGILKNFSGSFQLGTGDYFVLEGDEYDSAFFDKEAKFLHYHPQILILNSVEFDHADIYRDLDHVLSAFKKLISKMPPTGVIFACGDCPNVQKLILDASCKVHTFGFKDSVDLQATHVELKETASFTYLQNGKDLGVLVTPMMGRHNIANLLGVIGMALELGIPLSEIQTALSEFQGIKRRQEIIGELKGITLIDDFAHHPTAVLETLLALRHRYPKNKLWAVFEPRSNTTRRKVFQKDFVSAFDPADEMILASPYLPEKIPEKERLEPKKLVEEITSRGKKARYLPTVDEIVKTLTNEAKSGDVVCFMSNGGFGNIYNKMIQKLS